MIIAGKFIETGEMKEIINKTRADVIKWRDEENHTATGHAWAAGYLNALGNVLVYLEGGEARSGVLTTDSTI